MEETKKKATKKVNIKNKKVVKSTLANASIKGKKVTKKTNAKVSTIKKKPTKNEIKEVQEKPIIKEEVVEKKKKTIKTPNNIKKKTTVVVKKEEAKKQVKKKKKDDEKSFTTKIIFPKEWHSINTKNTKNSKKVNKELENPKTFKGKLKKSIFESIDEKELEARKKKEKESFKKFLLILLIILVSFGLLILVLVKYNDFVKKQLAVYSSYRIGDKVYLDDDSLWYVVSDTDSREEYVKLLSSKLADINFDGVIDANDTAMYNSENKTDYDVDDENSAAYILNNTLKKKLQEGIGSIKEISLLTTNEYVKIRERMNFGDEWKTGNWLASNDNQKWWVLSSKNDKIYVVSSRGTFYLSNAKNYHFVRPTIIIKKDLVNKVEEKKEISLDLTNGLQ